MTRRLLLILCLLAVATSAFGAETRTFAPVQNGPVRVASEYDTYAPDRILVKFTKEAMARVEFDTEGADGKALDIDKTGLESVDSVARTAGVKRIVRPWQAPRQKVLTAELGIDRWFMFETDGSLDVLDVAKRLERDRDVEAATVDWYAFPAAVPADPLHPIHWGHNNTAQMLSYNWSGGGHPAGSPVGTVGFDANAQAAWDGAQGYGNSGIVIAIIDSGVQSGHPDLRQVTGYDFGDNDSNPDDNSGNPGHGTACAGVAAAMVNNLGSAGVAGGCSIMPLKVANSSGSMGFVAIQNALYYAADNGADVISMSFGAYISNDPATDTALQYAFNAGCTMLAATGNENYNYMNYPANHATVIAVGAASPCGERKRSSSSSGEVNPGIATDPNGYTCDGERWWGSCYGTTTQDGAGAVDLIAPTILPTTDRLGSAGYDSSDYSKWFNGTSCATPYAAGVAALVKAANPSWTPTQIRNQLVNTAQDVTSVESGAGWDRYTGYGMVDAAAAVGGGSPPTDSVTVTAPNGGETFDGGASTTITWTSIGSFTTVGIDYSTNGGSTWTVITSSTANDGSFGWTVPATATTQGRVRVSGGAASDISNSNFTINVSTPATYATLPYTTGFESGVLDQYWTTATTGDARVRILSTNTPHSGSWHMTMDKATSGSYATNEAWLLLDLSGNAQVDLMFWWKEFGDETHTQDGVFFSDNGGSSFTKVQDLNGSSYTNNTWNQFNLDVDALAAANGLAMSSTFVVKFQQYDNYAMTTDGFAFDDISVAGSAPPADSVTVTAPNGGESFTSGNTTNVTWTSTGSFTTVNIDFSSNSGSTWSSVVAGTANDGSYTWTVPATATTQGRVRVSGGTASDMSNANFTITLPPVDSVTVTAPNGGETLAGGTATNITWTSTGTFTTVDIDYSSNGGSTWSSVTAGTANDGTHAWTVPTAATTQGRIRVTGGTASDTSNANFTVTYTPPAGDYATVPYSTGFEGGALDQYWSTSSTANGRVRLLMTNTPHTGSYHLTMDAVTNGTYAANEATLQLDLSASPQVDLSFWWKDFGDETHTQDGVYFSSNDGASFVKVQNLNGASYTNNTWTQFTLDVDALAAANGLTLSSTFVVKFQQYDNYAMTTDGFAFDDVSVTAGGGGGGGTPPITAETEPNADSATANGPVGDAVAVSGTISSSADDDWFYLDVTTAGNINISVSIGSSADLDWYLYDASVTQVARGYTVSNPEAGSYNASTGRYYVRVDGYNGTTSSYTLTVSGGLKALTAGVEKPDLPATFALYKNAPNPFNPSTKIAFDLPRESNVVLRVYDQRGREVRRLVDGIMPAGQQSVIWDGRDSSGQGVNSGMYIYRIEAEGFVSTNKMLLLK